MNLFGKHVTILLNNFLVFSKPIVPPPSAGKCDWGRGTCTYVNDPCPPNWERCPQFDKDCPVETNHCCCRKQLKSVPLLPLLRPVKKDGKDPKGRDVVGWG